MLLFRALLGLWLLLPSALQAQRVTTPLRAEVDRRTSRCSQRWSHGGGTSTSIPSSRIGSPDRKLVADHLTSLGLEVKTGVAKTGVVGVLKGAKPGPVVALRADMDALPVTEQVDVPFKSTQRARWNGQEVGVMHACGHDTHVAILMGVAEVLAGMRTNLPGSVKFIFQPAEEGAPPGEEGGAGLMIRKACWGTRTLGDFRASCLSRPRGNHRLPSRPRHGGV